VRSDPEIAPRRLLFRFGRHSGPAAGRLARGPLGGRECSGISEDAHIGGGQFVLALPASFQVGRQFVAGEDGTFLNGDAMVAEDGNVCGDRDLLRQASVSSNIEPIHAGILSLVKAEIPDLHEFPFRAIEDRLSLWSIDLLRPRMPPRFRLLRHRDLTHW